MTRTTSYLIYSNGNDKSILRYLKDAQTLNEHNHSSPKKIKRAKITSSNLTPKKKIPK